ncbi:N-acetylglucosamine-6-phosphate deacetylase [Flavihumibacter stibioxidans]|uniref:N-acetylglucosamine-6-phosphate deacetylase n=1 Tax=Flavihumibacter stibioxidans TaxID=1834163 RepID=A0ABR7MA46_9BACT|nr:N-acetylglucosamine-6-phosphate deacetylase [Flavihumibacter stibioxidans]MBC6491481.1 N-acetylglucosamine-6-phosphate deacetylase [Flavihumibacter stibioxidans]
MKTIITNGQLITENGIIPNGAVLYENGRIRALGNHLPVNAADEVIDVRGNYISPGFIDLHVHGGGGYDFMDGTKAAFEGIFRAHMKHGTTSMMPTTLTSTKEEIHKVLDCYEEIARLHGTGCNLLGVHIEGPYFAMNHRGAQDPRFIRNPEPAEYRDILAKHSCIRRWSIAPELEGALEMGDHLSSLGIIPSIAHTDAVYDDVVEAMKHGYSLVTHLYSAMNGVIRRGAYRFAGTVESAFLIDELDVEIIADGKHLPIPLLQLIFKIKGAERIALVTDAMRAADTNVTRTVLGKMDDGLPVIIEDDVAKLPDKSSFAGSIATADRLVRVMWKDAGINLPDVIKMMCTTPARIAGVAKTKGSLAIGKDADITIFDDTVTVQQVIIGGSQLY